MSDNRIDITFTVKASVAAGRKLFRDLLTGQIYWEPAEVPVQTEVASPTAPVPSPVKKPRRKKSEEGDK